jgi:hypothetical protein
VLRNEFPLWGGQCIDLQNWVQPQLKGINIMDPASGVVIVAVVTVLGFLAVSGIIYIAG